MEKLVERLQRLYADKPWILAAQPAVATTGLVERLTEWDATTLVVASNEGKGDLPNTEIVYTGSTGDTIVGAIRAFFDSVEKPNPNVQDKVDEFDPGQVARVLAEPFATAEVMVGRRTYGVRHPRWAAWEDKMRVDRLWAELEIPHAPFRIVDLNAAPDVAQELATELGTVWVGDNSQGWHGGAEMVRWVPDAGAAIETVEEFRANAVQVRVMPFLEGLPCSIHGWVTSAGVAVFLPVEINILRHRDGSGFEYAGVATNWMPSRQIVDEMREVARRVGAGLASRVDYRGPFGVDGILTEQGFRPTELNPRMSAGAGVQLGSVDVPLGLLMRAEVEGEIDVDPEWLESTAVEQRKRIVHGAKMVTSEARGSFHVRLDNGSLVVADSEEETIAEVKAGPGAGGSFLVADFDTNMIDEGVATGHLVAEALNLASEKWNLGLPELVPAPDVTV